MPREHAEWVPLEGDPTGTADFRSFAYEGMEYVDDKYVVMRHKETGAPLLAINPDDQRISWDPRFIDSDYVKKWMVETAIEIEREERRKEKGFGY